jgi:UrcA family protein
MTKYISLALALSVLGASNTHSQPATDQVSIRVKYADLNLSGPAGIEALHQRVRAAARSVCGDEPSASDLSRYTLYRKCVVKAQGSAAGQLESAVTQAQTRLAGR